MVLRSFTGEGQYNELTIVKADVQHAGELQHKLRNSDIRECLINGATPWRALHQPLGIQGAETYAVTNDKSTIAMFGTVPLANEGESVGSIWMLGSQELHNHFRTWIRITGPVFDYFLTKYDIVENIVPIEHDDTIKLLTLSGCMFSRTPTIINGYACLRFVRCVDHITVSFEEDERPASN
jgi:hypothetical protein